MKLSASWLKEYVDLKPPMDAVADRLTMAGLEVKKIEAVSKDSVWEVEITSNRPDWLSHIGVAREIAAVENLPLKIPPVDVTGTRQMPPGWKIDLKDQEGCPYYSAVYIEGIQDAQTPDFMRDRLAACGIRSIGLIVDITNYVLLETGQPLHAFDADLLKGKQIHVRRARAGEKMTAISGVELKLESADLMIADDECSVALAGVMGGKDTEVTQRTRNILLESAYFQPRTVRQSARRHALSSDSSYRFERKVDPEGVDYARERAVAFIKQLARPRFISGVLKAGNKPSRARDRVKFTGADVDKSLGVIIKHSTVASLLTRLGFEAKQESTGSWNVGIPSFRSDIQQPVDLIEEVARLYGFENIPENAPALKPCAIRVSPRLKLEERARDFFSGAGFAETVTFSLVSAKGLDEKQIKSAVKVNNSLNSDLSYLRPLLLPSLLNVIVKNYSVGENRLAFFEIANRYEQVNKLPAEERVAAIAVSGFRNFKSWTDPDRKVSFYDLKGAVEAFLDAAGIKGYEFDKVERPYLESSSSEAVTCKGKVLGAIGKVDGRLLAAWDLKEDVYYAEISLDAAAGLAQARPVLQEIPRFPAVERDLSVTVAEEVKAGKIAEEIRKLGGNLVRRVELFDLFKGGRVPKGAKNLGFRVTYQSLEKTLVSDEVQKMHADIGAKIAAKFQASFQ